MISSKIAVGLLGLRISIESLIQLGITPAITTCITCLLTIVLGTSSGKLFHQTKTFSIMAAMAVAICGITATLAMAATLPRTKSIEQESIRVIVTITLFSTIAMFTYPLISYIFDLIQVQAGVFMGSTIHDVAQTIGAGYTYGEISGETAVFIKMIRVTLLPLIILFIANRYKNEYDSQNQTTPSVIPMFPVSFIFCIFLNEVNLIERNIINGLIELSEYLVAFAVVAIGLKFNFEVISQASRSTLVLIFSTTVFIGLTNLLLVIYFV